jgi:hypothetical protein
MSVSAVQTGKIEVGTPVRGPGVAPGTVVTGCGTGVGNVGTYTVGMLAGPAKIQVGTPVRGPGVAPGTVVTGFGTGVGNVGAYSVGVLNLPAPTTSFAVEGGPYPTPPYLPQTMDILGKTGVLYVHEYPDLWARKMHRLLQQW